MANIAIDNIPHPCELFVSNVCWLNISNKLRRLDLPNQISQTDLKSEVDIGFQINDDSDSVDEILIKV